MIKRKLLYILLVVTGLGWAACGGATETSKPTLAQSSNSNAATIAVNTAPPPGINPATAVPDANAPPAGPIDTANKRKIVDVPASGPEPPLHFEPAGEDSEIASMMNKNGQLFEVRVFKSHPQLARVEATWLGATKKALKIILRDGKVLNVSSDRLVNLKQASTAEILAIAGNPVVAPPRPSVKTATERFMK